MYLTINRPQNRMLNTFSHEMDRWLNEFFNGGTLAVNETEWSPRADVRETDDAYQIMVDLPGLEKDDIKVKFEDNVLTISGERKAESTDEGKNYHRIERIYGSFSRSLRFPKDVNAQKVVANYRNGVLEISLPKSEEVKPKEIEVKID